MAKKQETIPEQVVRLYKEGYDLDRIANIMQMSKVGARGVLEKYMPDYENFHQPPAPTEEPSQEKGVIGRISNPFKGRKKKDESTAASAVNLNLNYDENGFIDKHTESIAKMIRRGDSDKRIAEFFNCSVSDVKAVKQVYSGANGVLLVWGTWIFIRIFDYVPAFGLGMPDLKPLQYAAIAFGFVIDILATLFIFRDCLSLSKTIKSRSYTVSEGFIVSKDSYKKPMSYGYVTMNSVVVKNDTERTYKLENITRKEFETCYIGNPVLLIKPDKQGKELKLYLVD